MTRRGTAGKSRAPIKVATYNVNSLRARLPLVVDFIRKESPDVLCLQETKTPDETFPSEEIEALGYEVAFSGERSYNGVAIASRIRLESISRGFEDGSGATRLISARVGDICVLNTYVPQGLSVLSEKFREKLDWFGMFYERVNREYAPNVPVLWVGDFNAAPEAIDVYDPDLVRGHVSFNDEVEAALLRFRSWGFTDIFRLFHREPGHYTFWDYTIRNAVQKGLGWRIDHIWGTQPMAQRATDAWISVDMRLAEKPSDHAPVIAVFVA